MSNLEQTITIYVNIVCFQDRRIVEKFSYRNKIFSKSKENNNENVPTWTSICINNVTQIVNIRSLPINNIRALLNGLINNSLHNPLIVRGYSRWKINFPLRIRASGPRDSNIG